jgi:hypothetical protein
MPSLWSHHMTQVNNAWADEQRRRWMRPNAHLYIRHDAYRFMPPGSPIYTGRDVVKYFWPDQSSQPSNSENSASRPGVVEWTGKRGRWMPENDADMETEQRRRELASTLREIHEFKSAIAKIRYDLAFERIKRAFLSGAYATPLPGKANFNPAQPRVPAGNPDGGEWTSTGGGTGRNDPRIISDAMPDNFFKPGAQYAARAPRGGSRPIGAPFPGATPRQEAEFQATRLRADRAINEVQKVDPYWRPTPSLAPPRSNESAILAQRDIAREAEARLDVLNRLNLDSTTLSRTGTNAQPLGFILTTRDGLVGVQVGGADINTRTVPTFEFAQIREQLLTGAKPVRTSSSYNGLWFERSDGTSFGLRLSADHGPTIDIIRSNTIMVPEKLKVHQK